MDSRMTPAIRIELKLLKSCADIVFYPVLFLRRLGVVPVIHRADQIACDAADSFKSDISLALLAMTLRTLVIDDAGIAAAWIAVDRVIDRTIADAVFFHAAHDLLKRIQIFERIAVQLDIGDMPAVGQLMVRRFQADLLKRIDRIINRDISISRLTLVLMPDSWMKRDSRFWQQILKYALKILTVTEFRIIGKGNMGLILRKMMRMNGLLMLMVNILISRCI